MQLYLKLFNCAFVTDSGVNLVWNLRGRGCGSKNFDFLGKFPWNFDFFSGNFSIKFDFSSQISEEFRIFRQFHKKFRCRFFYAISPKNRFFRANFKKNRFSQVISQKKSIFLGKFPKSFDFTISGNFTRNFDFPGKNWLFTAISWQIILSFFKSHHFRRYILYMIRYILRHPRPPATLCDPTTPCPKSGGRDPPNPPGLTPVVTEVLIWIHKWNNCCRSILI